MSTQAYIEFLRESEKELGTSLSTLNKKPSMSGFHSKAHRPGWRHNVGTKQSFTKSHSSISKSSWKNGGSLYVLHYLLPPDTYLLYASSLFLLLRMASKTPLRGGSTMSSTGTRRLLMRRSVESRLALMRFDPIGSLHDSMSNAKPTLSSNVLAKGSWSVQSSFQNTISILTAEPSCHCAALSPHVIFRLNNLLANSSNTSWSATDEVGAWR